MRTEPIDPAGAGGRAAMTNTRAAPDVDPLDGECLACYVYRRIQRDECDGTLRWVRRWRARCAPEVIELENWLEYGGGYCDCEVIMNVFGDIHSDPHPGDEPDPENPVVLVIPTAETGCRGVANRSTVPCFELQR